MSFNIAVDSKVTWYAGSPSGTPAGNVNRLLELIREIRKEIRKIVTDVFKGSEEEEKVKAIMQRLNAIEQNLLNLPPQAQRALARKILMLKTLIQDSKGGSLASIESLVKQIENELGEQL